jgi:hypothetical protein
MTKIAITPNPNGSGTFTIAAPNSNTDRTLTLPDAAGEVLTTGSAGAITETNLATAVVPLGAGQTWQTVTASRAVGVTYTNTTGRPIAVSVYFASADQGRQAELYVSGVAVFGSQASSTHDRITVSGVVPAEATYGVDMTFGTTQVLVYWRELR